MLDHDHNDDVESEEKPAINQLVVSCGWEAGLESGAEGCGDKHDSETDHDTVTEVCDIKEKSDTCSEDKKESLEVNVEKMVNRESSENYLEFKLAVC